MYKDKVCVITGASSGMGRSLALRYAAEGAHVAICDVASKPLATVAKECQQAGAASVIAPVVDVSSPEQVEGFAKEVMSEHPQGIDVLINNAGIAMLARIDEAPLEEIKRVIDINLMGVIHGTLSFLPGLKKAGGVLANTSSIFGHIGVAGNTAYCASKFGVRGFTESLWQEMEELGIHAISIHPGGVKTDIIRNARVFTETPANDLPERFDELAPTTADNAAEAIYNAIKKRAKRLVIGVDGKIVVNAARLFPLSYSKVLGFFGILGSNQD